VSASRVRVTALARASIALLLSGGVTVACAAEYRSIGNDPAILYDAPTVRGTRTAIAPAGMPVEIVVAQGDWVRIRDSSGGLSWVEKKAIVARRTVVATDPGPVDVRASPDESAPIVFRAQPGVQMEMTGAPSGGWVGVRHRDGPTGFVRVGSVWGE
jgi:Bacterial SH3 domain